MARFGGGFNATFQSKLGPLTPRPAGLEGRPLKRRFSAYRATRGAQRKVRSTMRSTRRNPTR